MVCGLNSPNGFVKRPSVSSVDGVAQTRFLIFNTTEQLWGKHFNLRLSFSIQDWITVDAPTSFQRSVCRGLLYWEGAHLIQRRIRVFRSSIPACSRSPPNMLPMRQRPNSFMMSNFSLLDKTCLEEKWRPYLYRYESLTDHGYRS